MRKKLTMLMASLFLVLGTAWAQQMVLNSTPSQVLTSLEDVSTDKYFVMQTADEYGMNLWLKDNGGDNHQMKVDNQLIPQVQSSSNYLWKITKSGDYYQVQNVGTGRYFPTFAKSANPSTVEHANAGSFTLVDRSTDGEGKWNFKNSSNDVCLNVTGWWGYTSANPVGWDSEGGNSNYKIFVADAVDLSTLATVPFNYYVGNEWVAYREAVFAANSPITLNDVPTLTYYQNYTFKEPGDKMAQDWVGINISCETNFPFVPESGKKYALKSKSGTYFSFNTPTDGTSSAASFSDTPTYFYITVSNTGYTFEDCKNAGRYIGMDGGWNVGTSSAKWFISATDDNGYVTICRTTENGNLGHNSNWTAGGGIFTNVDGDCNKWKLEVEIPSQPEERPFTIGKVYQLKGKHDGYYVYDDAASNNRLKPTATGNTGEYNQLWVLGASTTDGKYTLRNAATKGYMKPGSEWYTSKLFADLFIVERTAAEGTNPTYFNLSGVADAAVDSHSFLHCWGSTAGKNWSGDGGGSQFAFVEVTSVTVADLASLAITNDLTPLITEANSLKNNAALAGTSELAALNAALTTANGLTSSQDWDAVLVAVDELDAAITEAENYIATAPEVFNPTKGKAYILKVKDKDLYLDIRTLGIHDETVSGTNNISLGARPYPIYFEEGANGTWKMKNANGKYVGLYPQKAWDPVISTTAHNWTIALENEVITIAREAGKFVNANSVAAGKPLYCDKETPLQFELLNYDDVDFIVGAGLGKEGAEGPYVAIKEIDADGTTTSLPVGMGWILTVEVENPNGASHGQWGSSILATGKEPFPYKDKHNGFQLYLQSATNGSKKLDVVFSNADHIVNNVDYKGDFKAVITYDGTGNLKVVTTNAAGTEATNNYTIALPEITEFAYGLPTGINIKRLSIEKIDPEYTFTIGNTPSGVTVQYNGQDITSGTKLNESKLNVDLFTATDVSGYTWKVVVDKEQHTLTLVYTAAQKVENPEAVVALVNRIGGNSAADKFKFVLDPSINSKQETFVLGADGSKILIKGSTLSAITTGLGWYLNNVAHINIAWNSLNEKTATGGAYVDLSNIKLPLPAEETHSSDAKYRYYLNYCTFGYSMTSWTWTRWQQEIDWMALHGINMPLQIVGLEEVWRKFLTMKDANGNSKYGYSESDAMTFVAGPAFTAWWGMNNLEGWGGTGNNGWGGVQDPAWYKRQANLAKQITDLQRSLGMQPVLPGFSGMVPSNFATKTGTVGQSIPTDKNGGSWGGFTRPHIIDPDYANFAAVAADYYACLKEVMGESQYYSMDPFHEDGVLSSNGTEARYAKGYKNIFDAMEVAKSGSQWVIQQWQWKWYQKVSITAVPAGRLIALDLFSDGKPAFDSYNGYAPQDAVFCAIPNFGGRSGLMGRLQNVTDNYFSYKAEYASIKGIGTAPEAIEQTPVTYDLIYQLPWMNGVKPDVAEWVANYAVARYGEDNAVVKEAWSLLRQGPLNYGADGIQGPVEDVWAARPNLEAYAASSWGSTISRGHNIPAPGNTYTVAHRQMLIDAVYKLIDQEDELALTAGSVYESNYSYDIVEFGGAVMADYAHDLLLGIRDAKNANNTELYEARRNAFLQLILDMDAFRGTNLNFRLGKWTQEARDAAKEAKTYGATTANEDWYEFNNARTIITTWGDQSQNSGLKDYSYRSWQGLLADYYYPRWKYYFDNSCTDPTSGYFFFEWNWAHGMTHQVGDTQKSTTRLAEGAKGYSYSRTPQGNTVEEAKKMLGKYIIPIKYNNGTTYYAYRTFATDLTDKVTINVAAGATVDFAAYFGITNARGTIKGNFVNSGSADINQAEINATEGTYTATITLTDGTELKNLTVTVEKAAINAGYYYINYNSQPMFIGYNAVQDEWLNDEQTNEDYVNNQGYKGYKILGGAYTTDAEADKVFAIVPNGNGYSIAAQGKYLKAIEFNTWRHIQFSDKKDEAGEYVFHEVKDIANAFKIQGVGENDGDWVHNDYMHIYNHNENMIVGPNPIEVWENGVKVGEAPTFTLTPITNYTVTIPEKGYLPLCLPFNVILPNGVVAYDINDLSKEKLALGSKGLFVQVASTNDILKAGTPVILKAASGQYTLTITMNNEGAKTSATGSVLRGNYVKQTLPTSSEVKRFVLNGDNFEIIRGGIEIPANSCWIETNESNIKDDFIDLTPDYIEIGDWKFRVQETGKGLTITDCVATGSGHLVIDSKYTVNGVEKEVIAISDDFLYGNTDLTEITLPATLTSVGNTHANYMFDITYSGPDNGAGDNIGVPEDENNADQYNAAVKEAEEWEGVGHNCDYKVLGTSTWRMTVNVTLDENVTHFNQYGSCLLATKVNTLSNNYNDRSMQLYLRADKGIVLKLDQTGDTYMFNNPKIYTNGTQYTGNTFTFILENDGAGGYIAKMVYGNGTEEVFEITAADHAELHDIETIWSSLGTGINVNVQFDKLTNNGLFVGCTNLTAIHVTEDNPSFSSCKHGVLYNDAMTHIIRFPEGGGRDKEESEEIRRHFETPRSVTMVYAGALHDVDADITFHSNPKILYVDGHEKHMIAKYHLVIDDDANVIDFNSNNTNTFETVEYKRAPLGTGKYGTIMLPFKPNRSILDKYNFFELKEGGTSTITFTQVQELEANVPYLYKLKTEATVEADNTEPLDVITAGESKISATNVIDFTVSVENQSQDWISVGCYSKGTVKTNSTGETNAYYGVNQGNLVRVATKFTKKPYRVYYMLKNAPASAPAVLTLRMLDGSTQVIAPSEVEGWEENIYYDLMGRRVMNPTNGIYIVNGKKVIL